MHHNYVGKLVKINLFDKMHLHMSKNKILNLIKPTINEIAKYVPGESEIDGKKTLSNFPQMSPHSKFQKNFSYSKN